MAKPRITIPSGELAAFCSRWRVSELALFGSVLRDDFKAESDIDVLIDFMPGNHWSLFDIVQMQDELQAMFGRKVDLVEGSALRNPFRRHAIMTQKEVLFAAA